MSELLGWVIVAALVAIIAGICVLSHQIERQTQTMLRFLLESDEIILDRLARPGVSAAQPGSGEAVNGERRRADRRNPLSRLRSSIDVDRRGLPHRRLEDLFQQ